MRRIDQFPHTYGVRLNLEDRAKLDKLCAAIRRPSSEVFRLLLRSAQIPGDPVFTFTKDSDQAPDAAMPQGYP